MKKMYVLVSMLFFIGGAFAQQKSSNSENQSSIPGKTTKSEVKILKGSPDGSTVNKAPEDIVFSEDFANGLDGNNELSLPWGIGGDQGSIWEHNFDGPMGQFSDDTGPLESETASNGFMLIDCDLFNADLDNLVQVNGWIESPSLDLSDLGSVLVDFTTYYRYCCYDAIPAFISVSIDGGNTWQNFKPYNYGQFIEDANNGSGTLNVTTDISSVAANQSDVKIRFAYMASETAFGTSFTHYYYGVDDVVVYENPYANNLEVLQVMNGDVDSLWEFKNYPLEQSTEILLGAVYGNYGSAAQTGVSITWDIISGDNVVHTNTVELGEVPTTRTDADGSIVQNIDTAWVQSGYTIDAIGIYTIRTTITAIEEDEVPETNLLDRNIEVTLAVMSHDDLENLDVQLGPRDADDGAGYLYNEVGYGTRYFVFNEGSTAYGLQVVFGGNTTLGAEAVIAFYEVDENDGLNAGSDNMPSDVPLTETEFIVTEADTSVSVFIPFLDAIALEVGKTYFGIVLQYNGDEEIWVRGTDNTDTDNSSYVRSLNGDGDPTWFSRTSELAVRLGFSETTAINEAAKLDLKMVVAPNPANDYTNVSYELKEAKKVSYTLYDVNGRTIVSEELGSQTNGVHKLNINTSSFDAGVYYLIMTVGESTVSEKIVISK